jgi:hypothetical protein
MELQGISPVNSYFTGLKMNIKKLVPDKDE